MIVREKSLRDNESLSEEKSCRFEMKLPVARILLVRTEGEATRQTEKKHHKGGRSNHSRRLQAS